VGVTGAEPDSLRTDRFGSYARIQRMTRWGDLVVAVDSIGLRQGTAWCFADVSTCNQSLPALLVSPDGIDWRSVALPDVDQPAPHEVGIHLFELGGRLAEWHMAGNRPVLSITDHLGPTEALLTDADPGLDFLVYDPTVDLMIGVDSGLAVYTHCGIDALALIDGRVWTLDTQVLANEELGTLPGFGGFLYGFARRVSEDRVDYRVDDRLVASYTPSKDKMMPGCL